MSTGLYLALKWLHVTSASIAFGSNVTHFFWLMSANGDPPNRANILRVVKKIDDRLAVPAYILAIACGATLWLAQWPFNTPWLLASLALTTLLAASGVTYGPFMKRWIRLAGDQTPPNARLTTLAATLTLCWAGISASVLLVLYLMIWKPALW